MFTTNDVVSSGSFLLPRRHLSGTIVQFYFQFPGRKINHLELDVRFNSKTSFYLDSQISDVLKGSENIKEVHLRS
ncbi:unnamed protein product [Thlaspi arvense]|uniref:Uncharacterized protein n=1 Tax=Thlaspi arvense TaxID=13288 RepID=A0AAU9RQT7_THLAR|nr:unnamed protein product [Thlaspi arvense]